MSSGNGPPPWAEGAVVYGVIPGLFGADGFDSVRGRLAYLAELGVEALWLSPVNATLPGDFGYAVTDYFELREDGGGTKEQFRALVRSAHELGIRVLMDFVPNHTSKEHPYFRDAQERGAASPYYNYYDRRPDPVEDAGDVAYVEGGAYTHYFNWPHLPNLNYDNPAVERWMMEAFCYWVRELDVDGFRVDAAWGIRQRKPEFWPRWRRELKRIKPDLLLLAEASARDPYYFANGFDAAYDWTDELGRWAWEGVFADASGIPGRLHAALTNGDAGYAPGGLVFRFLNNNDTGERFVSRHGEGLTRVAAALLLTVPGIPCVYSGDEVGAEFLPYSRPAPLGWEDRLGLRPHYKRLIALRRETPVLRSGAWLPLPAEPAEWVYAYLRHGGAEEPPVLVALNFSERPAEARVTVPEPYRSPLGSGPLADMLRGVREAGVTAGEVRVRLPPYGATVLSAAP